MLARCVIGESISGSTLKVVKIKLGGPHSRAMTGWGLGARAIDIIE
jgi:hypothetical protein